MGHQQLQVPVQVATTFHELAIVPEPGGPQAPGPACLLDLVRESGRVAGSEEELARAGRAMQLLARTLEEQPEALIRGKSGEP